MGLDDEMRIFKENLNRQSQDLLTPGCTWATVKEVDWDNKSMTAIGLADELEYYDVQLGLGSLYRKPVVGSLVMLGVPELQGSETFLIEAAEVEEYIIEDKAGFKWHLNGSLLSINGEKFEGIVKAPELKKQVDKNTKILEELQKAITQWVVAPNDGGSAFKALLSPVAQLPRADLSNIQNTTIKHGDGN